MRVLRRGRGGKAQHRGMYERSVMRDGLDAKSLGKSAVGAVTEDAGNEEGSLMRERILTTGIGPTLYVFNILTEAQKV